MGGTPYIRWLEGHGQRMRGRLRLAPTVVLDPAALAREMGVEIITPREVEGLSDEHRRRLLLDGRDHWSAGTIGINGTHVVVLNPTHAPTRQRATIMEELSHLHLGHVPSELLVVGGGVACRSFKKSQEKQAYGVGAAALVPIAVLEAARGAARARADLARHHGVSEQLVVFREHITGIRLGSSA